MNSIHIYSNVESAVLSVESAVRPEDCRILDRQGNAVACPRLTVERLENGLCRCRFDASRLTPWTPDTPVLYDFAADGVKTRFGFMDLRPEANRFLLLNGAPCYLRGCIRGITAHDHPNMTGGTLKDAAIKYLRQAKKYGFNLVRFHSAVPAPAFVEAADEEGFLIHMEIGFAYDMDDRGEKKNPAMDNKAWEATIRRYRNHPAAAIFCIGNEMHHSGHYPAVRALYELGKRLAPGKLIMDNSGWGEFDRRTADVYSQHIAYFFPFKQHRDMFRSDAPWRLNGSAYDEPLDVETQGTDFQAEIHRAIIPARPVIAHEAVHYIDIPDYQALARKFDAFCAQAGQEYLKQNGIEKPRYLAELPELIARKGLTDKMPDYIAASQQFKMAALKIYLERCRLSTLCGFEMLQFADCLKYENKNGIVDCFDDDKYISASWMRQFNADAVLLAEWENEAYYYSEPVRAGIFVSDFLRNPAVTGGRLLLTVKKADGSVQNVYDGHNITLSGGVQKIADVVLRFDPEDAAQKLELRAEFTAPGEIAFANAWNFWLYPRTTVKLLPETRLRNKALEQRLKADPDVKTEADAVVTDILDDAVFADLAAGKDVLLLYHRDAPGHQYYLPGALERFKPCIWDRGSNLGGIVYSPAVQKALASGRYFDLNWQPLLEGGYKVCLDDFPAPVEELVCGVDKPVRDRMKGLVGGVKDFIDRDTLRNFSHLFSVKVGPGTLTVCTFALTAPDHPAVANFLAALFNDPAIRRTDKAIAPEALKHYLAVETAKGVRQEDVMNHFWELDNKLVEDTLFWEQMGLDLRKIR